MKRQSANTVKKAIDSSILAVQIAAVQAAFAREIAAEIEGIIPGLETNEIVFAK